MLLPDVLENFRNICIKIYELDPAKFLSTPGLVWQDALKKTDVKLELLIDIDVLLMDEKDIRGGICNTIYWYARANINIWKIKRKIKNRHILIIGM